MKQSETCQIQTENCTCVNRGSFVQMDCLKDRLSIEIYLDFGQIKKGQSKNFIALTIRNKFINQIKTFSNESGDSRMIVALRIEDCKMKELKANSFERMTSLIQLILNNDEIVIIQMNAFKRLELKLKHLFLYSNKIKSIQMVCLKI